MRITASGGGSCCCIFFGQRIIPVGRRLWHITMSGREEKEKAPT